jgi:hypothetical protein
LLAQTLRASIVGLGVGVETSTRRQTFAKPHNPRKRIGNDKAAFGRRSNQQSTVVGAEVQCSV